MSRPIECLLILLCVCLLSCGAAQKAIQGQRSGNSDDATGGAFLSPATFSADERLTSLSSAEATRALNSDSTYYNKNPKSSNNTSGSDTEKCQVRVDRLSASKTELSLYIETDSSGCPQTTSTPTASPNTPPDTMNSTSRIRLYLYLSCSDTDLSSAQGQSAWDFLNSKTSFDCSKDKVVRTLSNAEVNLEFLSTTLKISSRGFSGMMAAEGGPCIVERQGSSFTSSNCGAYSKGFTSSAYLPTTGTAPDPTSKVNLSKVLYDRVHGENEALFFSGGNFKVTYNNWTGTVTNTGPATPPAFVLTDGSQSTTGTFSGITSSRLAPISTSYSGGFRDLIIDRANEMLLSSLLKLSL